MTIFLEPLINCKAYIILLVLRFFLFLLKLTFRVHRIDLDFSNILVTMEIKFRKFHLAYVMDLIYNIEGIKLVIQQISNALNFKTSIAYRNKESCLREMYQMFA